MARIFVRLCGHSVTVPVDPGGEPYETHNIKIDGKPIPDLWESLPQLFGMPGSDPSDVLEEIVKAIDAASQP